MLQSLLLLPHFFPFPPLSHPPSSLPLQPHPHLHLLRPFLSSFRPAALHQSSSLAELPPSPATTSSNQETGTQLEPDGPVELPASSSSQSTLFAVDNNPSPLQVATSVLLTGAISVFLFRSFRRRARRAKELRVRSTGMKKTKDMKEEALESLKAFGATSIEPGGPPSPVQLFLGGIAAGVIAVILYKFTTTVEAALNRQAISDNFSVRQITITVRTIVNGLCYLATFVFGINSVGLLLYSIQLTFSSFMERPAGNSETDEEDQGQSNISYDVVKSSTSDNESRNGSKKESSEDS